MASLRISCLLSFFSDEHKSIKRGENHYQSGHVESFMYLQGVLRGEVHASMKNKTYKVTVFLDETNDIKSTECECPRGQFKCSHAAALFIHAIHNLSRTDVECQWKRKKKRTTPSHQSATEMFPPKKAYNPLSRSPTTEDRDNLYNDLRSYGKFTGLCWLMSPEPAPKSSRLPVTTVEEIIFSEAFLQKDGSEKQLEHFIEAIKVEEQAKIQEVSKMTIGQRNNPAWHLVRKGRLTASNFGCVLRAKRATPSLIKRLLGQHKLSGVKAIEWGVNNEVEAVSAFTRQSGLQVIETGIWLDSCGFIGASPDGLVGDEYVLEVKCPYTQRNSSIDEALKDKNFCLEKGADGSVCLKKNHDYWHQVQGQMFLTKRKLCFFVVWTTKQVIILNMVRDEAWGVNLDILQDFYFSHIFPKVVENLIAAFKVARNSLLACKPLRHIATAVYKHEQYFLFPNIYRLLL